MARQQPQRGRSVYGDAGGGLVDAKWAANDAVARVGRNGELKTAEILNKIAASAQTTEGGPTVLHDLAIPIPGFTANIDHVVVSGRTVLLVDSKAWAAGFYWTVGGTTRRGWAPFKPADKKTMAMARDALTRFLDKRGVKADIVTPVVVIWPTGQSKPTRVGMLKVPGARAMLGTKFTRSAKKLTGRKPADPAVVQALLSLVNNYAPRPGSHVPPPAPFPTAALPSDDPFGPAAHTPAAYVPPRNGGWLDPEDPFAAPFTPRPAAPVQPMQHPMSNPDPLSYGDTDILRED